MSRYVNRYLLSEMMKSEARLRMRRTSTLVAMLVVVAITWLMIPDPASGNTLIAVGDARVRYNSVCLALGSSLLSSLLFGLAGFYLVRGRMQEDVRSGAGAVMASMPVSNRQFIFGRWLGGVAYLCFMVLVFLLTVLVLHLLRGEGPIQLGIYLQSYALVLLPACFFAASMALLCESFAPLMGKSGDVLYFFIWTTQIGAPVSMMNGGTSAGWNPALLFDFSATGTAMSRFHQVLASNHFSLGIADFNHALAPVTLSEGFWSVDMIFARLLCLAVAMLPLLPAIFLFHRFSPDKVKSAGVKKSWSLLRLLNRLVRPLAAFSHPLFALSARLPGLPGQIVAELALTVATSPVVVIGIAVVMLLGSVLEQAALSALVMVGVACWGVQIADLSVRDFQSGSEDLSGVAHGGRRYRYLRQLSAGYVAGLLLFFPVIVRWFVSDSGRALALVTGLFALSAAASFLGRLTRTARTFLALFLFGLYIATQARTVAVLDVVGFNGMANTGTIAGQLLLGMMLCTFVMFYERTSEK